MTRDAGYASSVLHVTNGDSVGGTLREAGVAGEILTWADVLHDGPVPGGLSPAALRRVRAEHLGARGWGRVAAIERRMAARDRTLAEAAKGRYVLWFEADLYDQLQLVQVLDALRRLRVEPDRLTLVSVGEYRGIAHFGGLGELGPEQLAALLAEGVPLTAEALELASAAWSAFTAPDPAGLAVIAEARSAQLRFVGEAFARVRQEYPSRADGLSLTQRRILLAAADGPVVAGRVHRHVWDAERRPFLADSPFFACLLDLAGCAVPLLAIDAPGRPLPERPVRVTADGGRVLAAGADHVRLSGIDRWVGGVHLAGEARWRYDERLETLVSR
jgi:hypothetical protein